MIVYLNGAYLPQNEANVSVMDRGFLFGDGVYEVIPVYNGKLFRLEQHIARLERSLSAIKVPMGLTIEDWRQLFQQLLTHNAAFGKNQSIYLQITRGVAPVRNHAFPETPHPTIFAYSIPLKTVHYDDLAKGMSAITLDDKRWKFCQIKSISLLANVLHYQTALDQGSVEAILIRDGEALEGATSNLFIVKDGLIQTPPLSDLILGGVTRDLVLQLCHDHHFPFEETPIPKEALYTADEVWITSSTREIYPITQLDDHMIGSGKSGDIWHKMIHLYHDFIINI